MFYKSRWSNLASSKSRLIIRRVAPNDLLDFEYAYLKKCISDFWFKNRRHFLRSHVCPSLYQIWSRREPIYLPFFPAFYPERTMELCSTFLHLVTNNANSESRYLRCVQLLMSADSSRQGVNMAEIHSKGDSARNLKPNYKMGLDMCIDIKKH